MKVIFNTWSGAFFQKGGGEVQLLQTKTALEQRGHEITFFDQWAPDTELDILHQFAIQAGVEHVVKRYKNYGIPVIISPILWYPPLRDTHEYKRMHEILNLSDIICTNSHRETDFISEHFGISKSKFSKTRNSISNAYLSKGSENLFRNAYNVDDDFILTVGNIDERKATHLLVEACKRLNRKLIVIGHIKEKEYFNSFKNIYSNCRFLGPIENEEMLKSAYAACQLFALPSYFETPGIAALEAASQGAPIVITNEGCAAEYFKEYAIYVSPLDVNSVIHGIEDGLKKGRIKGIDTFILNNYTWDQTAKEIEDSYYKLIPPKNL